MAEERERVVASLGEVRAGLQLRPGPLLLILSDAPVTAPAPGVLGTGPAKGGSSTTIADGAAKPTAPDAVEGQIDLQLVRPSGAPAADMEVELVLPDGSKIAGKTGADGHFVARE